MSIVWITGIKGFIGKNLSKYLSQKGDKVIGIGHGLISPTLSSKFGISHCINGEVNDSNLRQLLDKFGTPDIIYHLAGGSSVGLSMQIPAEDFRRSVSSTLSLLEWIRVHAEKTKLVFSSSAAIYGDNHMEKISEEGNFTPFSPYGFHKRAAELLCESYSRNFRLNIAIVRLFSVYGPELYKQLLWDLCIRLRESPDILELHGSGNEIRDWLFIDDAVEILAAASDKVSHPPFVVNAGTGIGISVREVTTILCQTWKTTPQIRFSGQQRTGDPFSLVADIRRLQTLNLTPKRVLSEGIAEGIAEYVHWFKSLTLSETKV